jgi:hypothetical protein
VYPEKIYRIIRVESYSGFRPDERPLKFEYNKQQYLVNDILEHWYEGTKRAGSANYKYFKVRTQNGKTFTLRYNMRYRTWAIRIDQSS